MAFSDMATTSPLMLRSLSAFSTLSNEVRLSSLKAGSFKQSIKVVWPYPSSVSREVHCSSRQQANVHEYQRTGWNNFCSAYLLQPFSLSVCNKRLARNRGFSEAYHRGAVRCSGGTELHVGASEQQQKEKRRIVFLGTPEVAAGVLQRLLDVAAKEDSCFEVTAVVSQPAAKQGRGRKLTPSPVASLATAAGLAEERLLCPETAREEDFLEKLAALSPDLCITAAYGNILSKKFLSIPRFGTLNIHPSLLPLYRGASPVQRAVEAGEKITGVTVAFTVRGMDAGPIVAQEKVEVDPNVKAPELLEDLFRRGTELFLRSLPSVFEGSAAKEAKEQDHARKTEAPKVRVEEADLDFAQPALTLHNKVRAFAGWPGTKATFYICSLDSDGQVLPEASETITVKVITTRVVEEASASGSEAHEVRLTKTGLHVPCGEGSFLEVQELQPPSKKPMRARDFWNGLRGRRLLCVEPKSVVLS